MMSPESYALIDSLKSAPLLVGDLPEAAAFDRSLLGVPNECTHLNFDQKLGHLYEDALRDLLDTSSRVEVLASNLQVFDTDGRTLGELDYLLRDRVRDRHIHLELAVKFYLAVERDGEWQFPGPDPRDNWQRKLDRMRTHQFMLSQTPQAQALLRERYDIDSVDVNQLIYGCLFYPMSSEARPLPEAIALDCRVGRWLYVSEWERFFPEVREVLHVPKVLWPVELCESVQASLDTIDVTELHSLSKERCTMFVLPGSDEPLFLVPDTWLDVVG